MDSDDATLPTLASAALRAKQRAYEAVKVTGMRVPNTELWAQGKDHSPEQDMLEENRQSGLDSQAESATAESHHHRG